MPKKPADLAEEVQSRMQFGDLRVLTMPWKEFYSLAEIDRFRDKRAEDIKEACKGMGIVVGYGNNVVTFVYDTHFSM